MSGRGKGKHHGRGKPQQNNGPAQQANKAAGPAGGKAAGPPPGGDRGVEGVQYKELDGSILEGGGQILRNSFSLAALLSIPIHIKNIRAGREKPGLKAQHLKGLEFVNEMYQGSLNGARLHSSSVYFAPGKFRPSPKYEADTQTAGSVCLLAQVALPCIIFTPGPEVLILKGGTNAIQAPPADYLKEVFPYYAGLFGMKIDVDIKVRGFYPRGGGVIHVQTNPVKQLTPINVVNRGKVVSIHSIAFTTGKIPKHVSERMIAQAKHDMDRAGILLKDIDYQEHAIDETKNSIGDGTMLRIIAKTDTGCLFCASAIGERNKTAEKVGEEAAESIIKNINSGGCVDEYMQDQLIIFMALACGTSHLKIGPMELHTKTSIHFAQLLTGANFTINPTPLDQRTLPTEDSLIITCEGIGFRNPFL